MKKSNPLEEILCSMYMHFLMQRAEALKIMRRVPLEGYDISFLITDAHCLLMHRKELINFICGFVKDLDAEINQMKLCVNTRGRAVAACYMRKICENEFNHPSLLCGTYEQKQ